MPSFTPNLNLYKPGGGSTGLITPDEVVDIDRINANMDLIDAYAAGWGQASARNHQFYGPVSGMAGITGMKRGDTYKESDGSFRLWEYDGSNWVSGESGMYRIHPTLVPVTGASVSGGAVVLSNVTGTVTLTGLFTSRFDRYLIDVNIDNAAANGMAYLTVRTAGGPISTGYYNTVIDFLIGSPFVKVDQSNTASFNYGSYAVDGGNLKAEIFRPTKTVGLNKVLAGDSVAASAAKRISGGYVSTTAVLDGVDLNFQTSIVNGRIKVYGFA